MLSWWHWMQKADWRHPEGDSSSIVAKDNYPVVHIAFEDAQGYAQWTGKSLPTEAQWEYAARGSLPKMIYSWGNQSARETEEPNTGTSHIGFRLVKNIN